MPNVITDGVAREIVSFVGEHKLERGGALLGPRNSNLVSQFIADDGFVAYDEVKNVVIPYSPTSTLREAAGRAERDSGLIFKGLVQLHMGEDDTLSGATLQWLATYLDANPSLPSIYCPIVNRLSKPSNAANVLSLGSGLSLTSYEAWRPNKRPGYERGYQLQPLVDVRKPRTTVMLVDAAAAEVASLIEAAWGFADIGTGHIRLAGQHYEVRVMAGAGSELQLLFPAGFPALKPAALLTKNKGKPSEVTSELVFTWRLCGSSAGDLAKAIAPLLCDPCPTEPNESALCQSEADHSAKAQSQHAA